MPQKFYIIVLMTTTLLFGTSAHAEIHKWVDANGITHYSDKAPKTRKSQTLNYGKKVVKPARKKRAAPARKAVPKVQRPAPVRQAPKRVKRKPSVKKSRPVKNLPRPRKQTRKVKSAVITDSTGRRKVVNSTRRTIVEPTSAPLLLPETTEDLQPDLDAEEYDFREMNKNAEPAPSLSIKQKLCSEKRMLLAALQEKGFASYYDEEGNYRLAWGADGLYQGKRHYLSEADIEKKTSKVLFEVEQYCEDPHNITLQGDARAQWIRAEYCVLSKAVLEDLVHPFMRSTDDDIEKQTKVVEQHCSELRPGDFRDDERYYPNKLQPKVVMPLHLTLVADEEEDAMQIAKANPEEAMKQLLSIIE